MTAAFEAAPDSATYPANAPMLNLVLRILGWSQAELGRRLGVSEATVSRFLNGRAPITAANVRRFLAIVEGLRVEEVILLPGVSPDPPSADLVEALPDRSGRREGGGHAGDGRGTQVSDGRPA